MYLLTGVDPPQVFIARRITVDLPTPSCPTTAMTYSALKIWYQRRRCLGDERTVDAVSSGADTGGGSNGVDAHAGVSGERPPVVGSVVGNNGSGGGGTAAADAVDVVGSILTSPMAADLGMGSEGIRGLERRGRVLKSGVAAVSLLRAAGPSIMVQRARLIASASRDAMFRRTVRRRLFASSVSAVVAFGGGSPSRTLVLLASCTGPRFGCECRGGCGGNMIGWSRSYTHCGVGPEGKEVGEVGNRECKMSIV